MFSKATYSARDAECCVYRQGLVEISQYTGKRARSTVQAFASRENQG